MSHGRVLKPEEARLWHKIASSTRPIKGKSLLDIENQFEKLLTENHENKNHVKISKPYDQFHKTHDLKPEKIEIANAKNHKRVRRGKLEIDAILDLHGFNQEMAQSKLFQFVESSINNKFRTLLVITGKGQKNDKNQEFDLLVTPRGILRRRLKEWLHTPYLKNHIAGISEAHLKHGGSGAFYILLKAPLSNL